MSRRGSGGRGHVERRPPALRPGDRIAIVAPSGPVRRSLVAAGARRIEAAGFRVVWGRHVFDRRGHLAGDDRGRIADFNRALRDPDVRAIVMARGGYGAMRAAPAIDWRALRRDPKIFAGFSDATFLHAGFASFTGVRTLHGPNVQGFGERSSREFSRWLAWVTEPKPALRWRTLPAPRRLAGPAARVRGRTAGGNLVVLHYAAATGVLEPLRGAILVLEEVNEAPYRIDGLLASLRMGGYLDGVRAIVLGGFTRCVASKGHRELPLREVLLDHLGGLGIPVVAGLPVGHGARNAPFPLGAKATLDPRAGTLTFDEGLVR